MEGQVGSHKNTSPALQLLSILIVKDIAIVNPLTAFSELVSEFVNSIILALMFALIFILELEMLLIFKLNCFC